MHACNEHEGGGEHEQSAKHRLSNHGEQGRGLGHEGQRDHESANGEAVDAAGRARGRGKADIAGVGRLAEPAEQAAEHRGPAIGVDPSGGAWHVQAPPFHVVTDTTELSCCPREADQGNGAGCASPGILFDMLSAFRQMTASEGSASRGIMMGDVDRIPISRLALSALPPETRYPVWKDSISVIFEADWRSDAADQSFDAQVSAAHLGQLLLGETRSVAQRLDRTPQMIKRDGLDHCLLQVYTQGGTRGRWGPYRSSASGVGDVLFLDLAQPFISRTQDFCCLTLAVPRALLVPKLGAPECLHGRLLRRESALGRLLGEHLTTVWAMTERASASEAQAIALGLVDLLGAYFGDVSLKHPEDQPLAALTLRETIRGYIERNLGRPDLSPDHLVQRFRVSRSHLFKLFRPLGGVLAYIKRRRLVRAYGLLSRPQAAQQVTEVSMAVGFVNAAHFSRAFREQFGVAPRDVLEHGLRLTLATGSDPSDPVDRRYEHWLRELA